MLTFFLFTHVVLYSFIQDRILQHRISRAHSRIKIITIAPMDDGERESFGQNLYLFVQSPDFWWNGGCIGFRLA